MTCQRCDQTHNPRHCTGHVDLDDGTLRPCEAWPIRGGTVCVKHGGRAGQVRAKANERLARAHTERQVARTLGELGVEIPTSDGEALLELRDQYRGIVKALWTLASQLNLAPAGERGDSGPDAIFAATFHQTGQATGEAKPHVVMVMLGDWSDRLAKIDEACVRLGLERRRVQVGEAAVAVFIRAVDVMLARVVPPELHGRARDVLAGELELLDQPSRPAGLAKGA